MSRFRYDHMINPFRIIISVILITLILGCGTKKTAAIKNTQVVQQTEIHSEKIEKRKIEVIEISGEAETNKSEAEFCMRNTKMHGYRIQIYFSRDRKNWQPTEKSFKAKHPDVDVHLEYSPPHYRILVGQYFTKNSAKLDLIKYKRDYPSAVIANWDIWCKNAK